MTKIHDKMRKILALAERGQDGERDTAARMLEKMMKKYNITLDDLGVETKSVYYWNYNDKYERRILLQTYAKVINNDNLTIEYYKANRKCGFELTKCQYIEMDIHYSILRKDLKSHIKRAVSAFINANGLYSDIVSETPPRNYTKEELEEIEAIVKMSKTINPSQINARLEHK